MARIITTTNNKNPNVEDLKARDLSLAAVVKGFKKKTAKMNLGRLGATKDWIGLANSEVRIKSLKGQM